MSRAAYSRPYTLTRTGRRLAAYLDYCAEHPGVTTHLHFGERVKSVTFRDIQRWIIAHPDKFRVVVAQAYLAAENPRQGIAWLYEYVIYDKHAGRDLPRYEWDFDLWSQVAAWVHGLTQESLEALASAERPPAPPQPVPEQYDDDRQPEQDDSEYSECPVCNGAMENGKCTFCGYPGEKPVPGIPDWWWLEQPHDDSADDEPF